MGRNKRRNWLRDLREKKKKEKKKQEKEIEGEVEGPKKGKKDKKKKVEPEEKKIVEQPIEQIDEGGAWETVSRKGNKRNARRAVNNTSNQTEGQAQVPTGPIVQEILELGSKPLDPKATDEIRKKILNVLGLPPRPSKNDDGSGGGSGGGKWQMNV